MAYGRSTLHIRRHVARYRVGRGAAESAVRSALDQAWRSSLATSLADALSADGEDGVWLIRRLDVRACIAASWPAGRLARALAASTAATLDRTLRQEPDGEEVLWFPDRAAYLSRFLVDCADGRAAGRWQYREFNDLAARPSTTALRTAITAEPGTALSALGRLAPADGRRVLSALAPADASIVLRAFEELDGSTGGEPTEAIIASLSRLLAGSVLPAEPRIASLALFLDAVRHDPAVGAAGAAARAREAAELADVVRAAAPGAAEALAAALVAGEWRAVAPDVLARVRGVVTWPGPARAAAVQALRLPAGTASATGPTRGPEPIDTPLGGMFLLLPLLADVPWATASQGWPSLGRVEGSTLAEYLALIGALGAHRHAAALADPVLRLALDLPADLDGHAIRSWASSIPPGDVQAAAETFLGHLARLGKISGDVTLVAAGDDVVAVDAARGLWLGTAPGSPGAIQDLAERVRRSVPGAAVRSTSPWIDACLVPGDRVPAPLDPRLVTQLGAQVARATIGSSLALPDPIRAALVLAAQVVLRELAWRLPGFACSSLPYLADNVLSFGARVVAEPHRFVVHLGDPPLHLLLSLTGMNRRVFNLATTGGRSWVLAREP